MKIKINLNSSSESVIDDIDIEEIISYSCTSKRRKIDVYQAQIEMKTIHLVANGSVLSCRNFFCRGRELYRGVMPSS